MEPMDQVKQIAEDLSACLGVAGSVVLRWMKTAAYRVHIETEETGLVSVSTDGHLKVFK